MLPKPERVGVSFVLFLYANRVFLSHFSQCTERTKRLKQAKEEAVVEVEAFKNEKERSFKFLEQQVSTRDVLLLASP